MRRILLFPYLEVFPVSERFRLSMLLISVLKSVLLQPLLAAAIPRASISSEVLLGRSRKEEIWRKENKNRVED